MTQEDKELLLKDISARLPYGVKYECSDIKNIWKLNAILTKRQDDGVFLDIYNPLDLCKPYLFPLSSMTEEQRQEYIYIVNYISPDDTDNWKEGEFIYVEQFSQLMHFYHINHLDYMGLIPKGLAIDATNLNVY